MMKKNEHNEGSVLVISILITMILSILLIALSTRIIIQKRQVNYSYHRERAFALAESGIEVGLACLNEKHLSEPYPTISGAIPDMGTFIVEITGTSTAVTITSTGYSIEGGKTRASRSVEITASLTTESTVFDMAAFAKTNITTGFNAFGDITIDSYNSEGIGNPYNPASAGTEGNIGTNSISTFPKAVKIAGIVNINNIYIGEGGNTNDAIWIKGISHINKKTTLADIGGNRNPPPVLAPDTTSLPPKGSLSVFFKDEHINSNGCYDHITLIGSKDLIFDNGANFIYVKNDLSSWGAGDIIINTDTTLYIGGNLNLIGSSKIIIQNEAKLTLYLGGNITGAGKGFWNNSNDPLKLIIYGLNSCNQIALVGYTDFYGAIYAPKAQITLPGRTDMFGSFIGDKVTVLGKSGIHYDEALKNPNNFDNLPPAYNRYYVVRHWREIH